MFRPPDRRGENDTRPIATRKAGLENARAIVNNYGLVCYAFHASGLWSQECGTEERELPWRWLSGERGSASDRRGRGRAQLSQPEPT